MSNLQGKGIWTFYDDIEQAVNLASQVGAKYILCKVSQRGKYDLTAANNALALVRRNPALVPVAWTYTYLENPQAEADCIQRALQNGFAAFIIQVGISATRKFKQADELSQRVLDMRLDTGRIYLCADHRLDANLADMPYLQLAKIGQGGFMPMAYGEMSSSDRPNAANRVINSTYEQYERHKKELGYTIPPMPVISTTWDSAALNRMSPAEFKRWTDEVQNRRPTFVSVFRAGVARSDIWNHFKNLVTPVSETVTLPKTQTQVALVQPGGPGYSVTAYPPHDPNAGWTKFIDDSGHMAHARNTSPTQTLYASYLPSLTAADRYAVETYIPDEHATTHSANYFVVYYENNQRKEAHVVLRQIDYSNAWVPLGFFQLDPRQAEAGRVNLLDLTADQKTREIVFSAIRWRPVVSGGPGFDAPVGTPAERASAQLWPGKWVDANPYGSKYSLGYHTGADLNLNFPFHNADKDQPVYAIADGVVTYARVVPETWGGLIVINHGPLPDGTPVYARYAHVANILVKEGNPVTRGQQIAQVGLFGKPEYANYHLHFDISTTNLLGQSPRDWPAENLAKIKIHYVDPKEFIEDHRP